MARKSKAKEKPRYAAIGERIRILRLDLGMRQDDFAPLLGVTQGQLSKIERGMLPPSAEVLLKIRERTGKSTDWILTGKG